MLFFGMALFGSATPLSKLVAHHFPVFIAGGLRVLHQLLAGATAVAGRKPSRSLRQDQTLDELW